MWKFFNCILIYAAYLLVNTKITLDLINIELKVSDTLKYN